jgi:hypothetical protein
MQLASGELVDLALGLCVGVSLDWHAWRIQSAKMKISGALWSKQ